MNRVVFFGNSGSGKSSSARKFAKESHHPHLDLDEVAWKQSEPSVRHSIQESVSAIDAFCKINSSWIIEGCYASLISKAVQEASVLYFMNVGIETCISNCKARPWEPGKYPNREAQDKNLQMLIDWVKQYEIRSDDYSLHLHRDIYDKFRGRKFEITSNAKASQLRLLV